MFIEFKELLSYSLAEVFILINQYTIVVLDIRGWIPSAINGKI
jgi:hypothetical protein